MNLLILVNANSKSGFGHFFRILRLIKKLIILNCNICLVINFNNENTKKFLSKIIIKNQNLKTIFQNISNNKEYIKIINKLLKKTNTKKLIIDDYFFPINLMKKHKNREIIFFTDFIKLSKTDLEINYNFLLKETNKKILNDTKFLLIPDDFIKNYKTEIKKENKIKKILIYFGNVDSNNLEKKVLDCLLPYENIKKILIDNEKNKKIFDKKLREKFNLEIYKKTYSLSKIIQKCDFVVTSMGMTMWEVIYQNKPAIFFKTSIHQSNNYEFLKRKLNQNIKNYSLIKDLEKIKFKKKTFSPNQNIYLDTYGASRLAHKISEKYKLKIFKPKFNDIEYFFDWVNQEEVRNFSRIKKKKIDFKDHKRWFLKNLNLKDTIILIAKTELDVPIGQVRIFKKKGKYFTDIYVCKYFRGQNTGSNLLKFAEKKFFENKNLPLFSEVNKKNKTSILFFKKNGYKKYDMQNNFNIYQKIK